jgi:hypothetical protein
MGGAAQAVIGYGRAMTEGWSEYFFMIGSSAAALIGLMFVVVTLTAGRDRNEVELGKHLYTSPIVWHLGVILLLSGGAIAPGVTARLYGLGALAAALLGFAIGVRSAVGIARRPGAPDAAGVDMFWYGLAPAIAYVGLGAAAIGMVEREAWGAGLAAAALMALLLISIHAEWDLVTYLAPIAGPGDRQGR